MGEPSVTASRRFLRDRRAVAAVEFAIILPVMLLLYLGAFEASNAIIAKRRIDSAAETVGGIVARSTEMNATRMRNMLMISDAIVGSSGDRPPEITITTVKIDDKGNALVDWSRRGTAPAAAKGTPYRMPADLKGLTDAYFVFATVSYRYTPTIDFGGFFGTLEFARTFAFRPRKGADIPWK